MTRLGIAGVLALLLGTVLTGPGAGASAASGYLGGHMSFGMTSAG